MSRSPWHLSVLVLICLLARSAFGNEIQPTPSSTLQTISSALGVVHPDEETSQFAPLVQHLACQSQPVSLLAIAQWGKRGAGLGEPLSQVGIRELLPRRSARAETMRPSTGLTEIQLTRGIRVRVPPWWKGERPTLPQEWIPSSGCFS